MGIANIIKEMIAVGCIIDPTGGSTPGGAQNIRIVPTVYYSQQQKLRMEADKLDRCEILWQKLNAELGKPE